MKMYFFVMLLIIACFSCEHPSGQNKLNPKEDIVRVNDNAIIEADFPIDTSINNKELVLAIAEPILFSVFGKKDIESKRPYKCELINGNWKIWVFPIRKDDAITLVEHTEL